MSSTAGESGVVLMFVFLILCLQTASCLPTSVLNSGPRGGYKAAALYSFLVYPAATTKHVLFFSNNCQLRNKLSSPLYEIKMRAV